MTYRSWHAGALVLTVLLSSTALVGTLHAQELVASAGDAGMAPEDAAPEGLSLRSNVMVDDDVVRLGDLFMESLSVGDTPIAQAPAPGQTISLDARFLRQLARAYRLDWQPDSKFEKVLVGRMSQHINSTQVVTAINDAIHERAGNDARLDLVMDGGDVEFTLPTNISPTIGVRSLQYDPTTQRFAAVLVVPADGPTVMQRQVSGTSFETIDIPVFAHAMGAGATVQEADLQWISVRTDRLIGNVVTDSRQLVGMTTKRPLRTGQMLRGSDLVMTPAIRKNTLVTLALQSGQMNLTVTGRALEDAAIGQPIRVVNVNSKKELTGIVRDSTTIVVPVAGQLTLN